MKAFIISSRDILSILNQSTIGNDYVRLFREALNSNDMGVAEYIYNCFSCYLMNYVTLDDLDLRTEDHNKIFDRFFPFANNIKLCDFGIRHVNVVESLMGIGSVDHLGKYHSEMHDDVYRMLKEHHVALLGSRGVERIDDQLQDEMNLLVELITFVVDEIESRFLRYNIARENCYVLFGMTDGHLLVFTH